jgi:anti-sigma factor RsiW
MNCSSLDPLVTPYIDGELGDADCAAVDAHLRACPPCHLRVAAERQVHALMREHKAAIDTRCAPDALRMQCAEIARLESARLKPRATTDRTAAASGGRGFGRATSSWRSRLTPLALAASLFLVVGGAFVYQATDASARVMAAELAADHLKCFAMNRALRTHQSVAAVESSLAAGFGWPAHLPDPGRAELELVGERPCLYGEGKIAHIMYRQGDRPVSLFMLPNTSRTEELVEVLGHEAAIWCVGNRTFVLLARASKPEVERLAALVRTDLR